MNVVMLEVVLSATVGVTAAAIGAWAVLRARRPPAARLELVDVSAADAQHDISRDSSIDQEIPEIVKLSGVGVGGFVTPALDIKLRNPGGQAAFVKRIELAVSEAVVLPVTRFPEGPTIHITASAIPSWNYDVELPVPTSSGPFKVAYDVSQVVPAWGVDRFRVRLYAHRKGRAILYRIRVRLLYNKGGRSVVSQPLTVALPSAPEIESPQEIHERLLEFQRDAERNSGSGRHWLSRLHPDLRASIEANLNHPEQAITRYLDEEETTLRMLVEIAMLPGTRDPGLTDAVEKAKLTLSHLPRIREELLEGS